MHNEFQTGPGRHREKYATLEEYVISLFEARRTGSSEFKAMIDYYGREKMVSIWEKYQESLNKKST